MSEYSLGREIQANFSSIEHELSLAGQYAMTNGIRLSFHPGPFNVLASPNSTLVINTIKELNQHAEIMDMMGLPANHMYPINIHVGGHYGNKQETLRRFNTNFNSLSASARARLVVENDDKINLFSVRELSRYLRSDIPITFDYFHHKLNSDEWSEDVALYSAFDRWPQRIRPLFHYSSSKRENEDSTAGRTAHADYIHETINTHYKEFDIELEAKAKDLALLRYREINMIDGTASNNQ